MYHHGNAREKPWKLHKTKGTRKCFPQVISEPTLKASSEPAAQQDEHLAGEWDRSGAQGRSYEVPSRPTGAVGLLHLLICGVLGF